MLDWLAFYGGTILVAVILVSLIGLIVCSIRRDRKRGKTSCGSSCAGCPMSGQCHGKKDTE